MMWVSLLGAGGHMLLHSFVIVGGGFALGYRYCTGGTRGQAVAHIQPHSRRYATRQLTWFRRWEAAHWIEWDSIPDFEAALLSSTEFLLSRGYHDVVHPKG